MKEIQTNILIVGGGIAGLTLALLLDKAGIDTVVLEPRAPKIQKTRSTRTAALMTESLAVLDDIDILDNCKKDGGILSTLRIIDETGHNADPIKQDFLSSEIDKDHYGINFPVSVLQNELIKKVKKAKRIKLMAPALFCDAQAERSFIRVRTDKNVAIKAKLVVGADGRKSKTRDVAKIACREYDYKQRALTCIFKHSRPHNNTSTEFHRSSGPFTLVPLPGNQSSLVWVESADTGEDILSMSKQALTRAIQDRTRGLLGEVEIVSLVESWPLISMHAENLTESRIALVAEAAHVLHPMGAQGLNLSLQDVKVLADIISHHMGLGLDPGSRTVLQKYDRERQGAVRIRRSFTDGLAKFLAHNIGGLHKIRRTGLSALKHFPHTRMMLMQFGLRS